jgi:hypothetical protein
MSLDVSCPTCNSTFKVDEQHVGKHAKCSKCGSWFAISGSPSVATLSPTPLIPPPVGQHPAPPPIAPTPPPFETVAASSIKASLRRTLLKGYRFPPSVTIAGVFVALLIGYFVGRENLKYQLGATIARSITPQTSPPAATTPSERMAEQIAETMFKKRTPEEEEYLAKNYAAFNKEMEESSKRNKARSVTEARQDGLRRRYAELTKLRSEGKITKKRRTEAEAFWQKYEKLYQIYREDKITEEEYEKRMADLKAEFDAWDENEPPTMRAEAEAEQNKRVELKKRRDQLVNKRKPQDGLKQLDQLETGKITKKDIERQQAEAEA